MARITMLRGKAQSKVNGLAGRLRNHAPTESNGRALQVRGLALPQIPAAASIVLTSNAGRLGITGQIISLESLAVPPIKE